MYQNAALLAAFLLIYRAIAGRVVTALRTRLAGAVEGTQHGSS